MSTNPTSLADEGFLADEVAGVVSTIRDQYSSHFLELLAINRLLTRAQYQLHAHQESARELTCAALFVRSLAHCQAALILIERGMLPSARAITRCALEGLFNLGACAADWEVALAFVDANHVDRKRRAKYLRQVQDPTAKASVEQSDLDEILRHIDGKIEEVEARELRTREMAKLAGFEDMYLTAYAMLSGSVHSTVGDLDQHFRLGAGEQRLEMLTEPTVEHLEGVLLIVGETMVGLARTVEKVFDLAIIDRCEEHLVNFQRLYSNAN